MSYKTHNYILIITLLALYAYMPACATEKKEQKEHRAPFHHARQTFEQAILFHKGALEKNPNLYKLPQYKDITVEGQEQLVRTVIKNYPELLTERLLYCDAPDIKDSSTLCAPLATRQLTIPMVKLLLQAGASTHDKCSLGQHHDWSVLSFHLDDDSSATLFLTLLQRGADPTRAGGPHASMLHAVIDDMPSTHAQDRPTLIQKARYLILYGCDLDSVDKEGLTALERVQAKLDNPKSDIYLHTAQEAQEAYQPLKAALIHGYRQKYRTIIKAINEELSPQLVTPVINIIGNYSFGFNIVPGEKKT